MMREQDACLHVLYTRRSIREFENKPVPRSLIRKLVRAATYAPSALNSQPWRFVVLTDNDKKQFVRRCVDEATVELGLYKQNTVFIEHATLIVVFSTSDKLSHIMSCCAAIQNLLLAATCFGLGSVWMYRPIALDKHIKALKKLLKVPRNYVPIGVVAVGYSKARPRAPKRLPLSQIMFYNTMSR